MRGSNNNSKYIKFFQNTLFSTFMIGNIETPVILEFIM
jgi:hypothetical protein